MPQFIFTMKDLRKVTPQGKEILKGIWLSFYGGAKIGVLGANGAGKSTLLRIMAGVDKDFAGEAFPAEGTRIGYLPQEPVLDPTKNVLEHVEEAVAEKKEIVERYEEISANYSDETADEFARLQDQIDAQNLWELDQQLEIAMDALRLPPGDADVTTLSGGEKRRVALCRLLLQPADMLLLDEPTNHLDAESVAWLERFLEEYPGTVVAITHDRYFLDNVAGWILELDRGAGIPWEGNYSSWLEQKEQRLAQEEKEASSRRRTLERELEWVRMAPRARQAKGKARITHYEEMLAEEQAAEKRDDKREIAIPPGPRLGDVVIDAKGAAQGLRRQPADRRRQLHAAARRHRRRDRPERRRQDDALPHDRRPGEARRRRAEGRRDGRALLRRPDPRRLIGDRTAWEEISDGGKDLIMVGKREMNSRAYAASFDFRGPDQQKKVKDLSGGERNRLHLAKLLKSGGNLLLLDEPTNDLDVDTLRALEEALVASPAARW